MESINRNFDDGSSYTIYVSPEGVIDIGTFNPGQGYDRLIITDRKRWWQIVNDVADLLNS